MTAGTPTTRRDAVKLLAGAAAALGAGTLPSRVGHAAPADAAAARLRALIDAIPCSSIP
jgi:hypothetical protein